MASRVEKRELHLQRVPHDHSRMTRRDLRVVPRENWVPVHQHNLKGAFNRRIAGVSVLQIGVNINRQVKVAVPLGFGTSINLDGGV